MNLKNITYFIIFLIFAPQLISQEAEEKQEGHINNNKFRQLYQEFSSPNIYRAASGAPGTAY